MHRARAAGLARGLIVFPIPIESVSRQLEPSFLVSWPLLKSAAAAELLRAINRLWAHENAICRWVLLRGGSLRVHGAGGSDSNVPLPLSRLPAHHRWPICPGRDCAERGISADARHCAASRHPKRGDGRSYAGILRRVRVAADRRRISRKHVHHRRDRLQPRRSQLVRAAVRYLGRRCPALGFFGRGVAPEVRKVRAVLRKGRSANGPGADYLLRASWRIRSMSTRL